MAHPMPISRVTAAPAQELVACDLCGSRACVPRLRSRDGACYVACVQCGLVYVNPRLTGAALQAVYDDFAEGYYLPRVNDGQAIEGNDSLLDHLERSLGHPGRLLDVGCSLGTFLLSARRRDWQVTGIEIAGPAAEYARRENRLEVITGALPQAGLPPHSFDAVTLWACLEHTPDPSENLRHAHRVLRPSGVLALTVPNWSSLSVRLLGARYRYLCREHLYLFSPHTLRKMLEKHGFEVLMLTTNQFSPLAFRDDWRRTARQASSTDLRQEEQRLVRSVRGKQYLLPLRLAWRAACGTLFWANLGDNLLVFARKVAE